MLTEHSGLQYHSQTGKIKQDKDLMDMLIILRWATKLTSPAPIKEAADKASASSSTPTKSSQQSASS